MSDEIRTPPHSDEAERGILGAILIDNEKLDVARDRLDPTDFYRERHKHIFKAMLACFEHGEDLDVITVGDELAEQGRLEGVGGASFLTRLSNEVPSAANIGSYIDRVARYADYQEVAGTLSGYLEKAYDPTDDFADFAADLAHDVESIAGDGGDEKLKWADEVAEGCVRQAETWVEDDADAGLSTGYEAIDAKFKLEPTRLYVLAGRPGMGKSALAQAIQGQLSIDRDIPTAFFSMEMSAEQIGFRHICQQGQIDQEAIRRGTLSEQGWHDLVKATGEFQSSPIAIDETERLSLARFRAKARRLVRQHDVECLFVDYLQMMQAPSGLNTRNEKVGALAYGCKSVAKECDVPVVLLSQLNRGVESRDDKRPNIGDLRASGKIEEAADVIAMLYREGYYDDQPTGTDVAEVLVRKNRSGEIGKAELGWIGQYTTFRDLDRRHERPRT